MKSFKQFLVETQSEKEVLDKGKLFDDDTFKLIPGQGRIGSWLISGEGRQKYLGVTS